MCNSHAAAPAPYYTWSLVSHKCTVLYPNLPHPALTCPVPQGTTLPIACWAPIPQLTMLNLAGRLASTLGPFWMSSTVMSWLRARSVRGRVCIKCVAECVLGCDGRCWCSRRSSTAAFGLVVRRVWCAVYRDLDGGAVDTKHRKWTL